MPHINSVIDETVYNLVAHVPLLPSCQCKKGLCYCGEGTINAVYLPYKVGGITMHRIKLKGTTHER